MRAIIAALLWGAAGGFIGSALVLYYYHRRDRRIYRAFKPQLDEAEQTLKRINEKLKSEKEN
jgi:O-antigen/teichoic acid export membrane protein